jgi:hypothetical protein
MAVLNLVHRKTGTSVMSSSPAIPQARVLARLQQGQGGRAPAGWQAGGRA